MRNQVDSEHFPLIVISEYYLLYSWTRAIVVPIHKKGDPYLTGNYYSIILLSIVGKLYARFYARLDKLSSWMNDQNILDKEQIGFCADRSIFDHCITLVHLAEMCTKLSKGRCALSLSLLILLTNIKNISGFVVVSFCHVQPVSSLSWSQGRIHTIEKRWKLPARILP